ncbi:MAG: NADH-quinone oxidoreductase subunit NuoE [Dehalococcoidales bacterium]|nr:NADH-quinone oxidoreductase subunit NuoE [Dehalococcoidales bacterium]
MDVNRKEQKQKVAQILTKYRHDKSMLVSILQDVQSAFQYLPKEALAEVAKKLEIPLTKVYSVATFFKAFSLMPRGRHLISVCMGTACHVRGSDKVLDKIERELSIKHGETTADLRFSLETVNCVGACALGPMVMIDEEYHGQMNAEKVSAVLAKYA